MLRVPDCGRHTSQARGCREWGRDCHVVVTRLWQRLLDSNMATVLDSTNQSASIILPEADCYGPPRKASRFWQSVCHLPRVVLVDQSLERRN
jgi:hypothetical protein